MNAAVFEEMKRLAYPLLPEPYGEWWGGYWFRGTPEQAVQCLALQNIILPREPGGAKVSQTFRLPDGRKVNVMRNKARLVRLNIETTAGEREAAKAAERQCTADAAALKKVAEIDKRALKAVEDLKGQPATEEEFRELASETFWRQWLVFKYIFLGSNCPHASGFRFTSATVDVLDGFAKTIIWCLSHDGKVVFDDDVRTAQVRAALTEACKLDSPLQRFIERVKTTPPPQEHEPVEPAQLPFAGKAGEA